MDASVPGVPDIPARKPGETIIRFEGVQKGFGSGAARKVVYEGIDLDVRKGEVLTIMGGSGTGKSVLLKLLVGLLKVDAGRILVDGIDVATFNEEELLPVRRQIGMVFQGAALFDSLTVYENVAYPLREHNEWPEEKIRDAVAEKLSLVGLPGVEKMKPADLSGGMRKRVGLARALATGADVILYDEPTTGLDPTNTRRINELIKAVNRKLGVTSIVVTHDMGSAFDISHRLAMLYEKKITWTGTTDEARKQTSGIVKQFIEGRVPDGETYDGESDGS